LDKRDALPLPLPPWRVPAEGGADCKPIDTTKTEDKTMGHELFKGWTDHELHRAFAHASVNLAAMERKTREAARWRDIAYIAMLTGGAIPTMPTC
jgi:hypothetical protein